MSDLAQTLRDFIELFERLGVPYAVMGGLAVRVYAIPRPTYDVDFTVLIERDRLPAFYAAGESLGYTVPEAYKTGWVDMVANMPVVKLRLYIGQQGVDVDFFLAESAYQKEVIRRRQLHKIDELDAQFVSPEDLVLLKLIAARPRDHGDVADVLFTQGQLDERYLRHWAAELGVSAGLEAALANQP
jgi:hypothetical protein